jgi:hypothetical protein
MRRPVSNSVRRLEVILRHKEQDAPGLLDHGRVRRVKATWTGQLLHVSAWLLVAACRSSAPAPASPPLSENEMIALCERLHHEVVPCAHEFVQLNLDLRAQYSPEFAAQLSDPEVRHAAEQAGEAETAQDAEHAHERCTEFAKPTWGPAQPRSDLARLDSCYREASCEAKMRCLRPVIEPRFAYRAAHGGPHS